MKTHLRILLVIGILMTLIGPTLSIAIQAAKIDAVLTKNELANEEKLRLAVRLADANSEKWLWVIAGCAVSVVSGAGLVASKKNQNSHN